MKRQPTTRMLAVGLVLLGLGMTAHAGTLGANQYYTWGIDTQDLTIPDGSIITKAVLTFHDIRNWKNDGTDRLFVHLIENPPVGLSEYQDSDTLDTFADDGKALQSSFQTTRLAYSLQETDDALSWVWSVFKIPFQFILSDSTQVQYSSSLLELIDFAGTGTSFGFGIDPEVQDYTYSRITLELIVDAYEGAAAKKVLLFEVADIPVPAVLWSMDDAAATTRITDSGGLNLHGTAKQNTSALTTVGRVNNAIRFNGTSDFISCGNNAALLPAAWSVTAWVQCNDMAAPTLVSFGGMRSSARLQNNGKGPLIHMGEFNYRYFANSAWTTLKDGQWHHVVFTLPGSAQDSIQSAAMYLDGVAVAPTTTLATGPQNAKTGVFLGNTTVTGTQIFSGTMDEVALFNRALEDWEVGLLYENTPGEVVPVNRAPVLASIGAKSVQEGSALTFTISATDADNDVLTYSATGLPTGSSFNAATKTFSWTPGTGTAGSFTVTFRVQDAGGLSDSETVTIAVTPPVAVNLPVSTVLWSMNDAAATTRITDSGGLNLHGTATRNTSLLTTAGKVGAAIAFNGASDIVSCGNNASLLTEAWTVSAWVKCSDTVSPTLISFGGFRSSVRLQNNSKGQPLIHMGEYNYRYFASSAWTTLKDGQWHHVVFTLPGSAQDSIQSSAMYLDGVSVNPATTMATGPQNAKSSVFLGNTTATGTQPFSGAMDEVRLYNRVLTAQEISSLYAESGEVVPVNHAPVLTSIGVKSVQEGSALTFAISATDADNDALTYSATGLPTGSSFNAATKTFSWTPGTGKAGSYSVTFRVQDAGGLNASEIVTITVTAPVAANLPIPLTLWSMDDAAATTQITDSRYMGLHGMAARNTSLLTTPGKFGSAISFNGTSDLVSCGNFAAWLPGAWTVSAWVKCSDTVSPTLISFGEFRSSIRLQSNSKGQPLIQMGQYNYRYFDSSAWTTLKDGQWRHVVFTLPGSAQDSIQSSAMYLDGVVVAPATTMATGPQNAKSSVFLGNTTATGTQPFSGAMDEVGLYNRVLTAQEISSLFTAGQ